MPSAKSCKNCSLAIVDLAQLISKFQNYVIYYREHPQGIEIVRVLHAHMDKKKRLEPEERPAKNPTLNNIAT